RRNGAGQPRRLLAGRRRPEHGRRPRRAPARQLGPRPQPPLQRPGRNVAGRPAVRAAVAARAVPARAASAAAASIAVKERQPLEAGGRSRKQGGSSWKQAKGGGNRGKKPETAGSSRKRQEAAANGRKQPQTTGSGTGRRADLHPPAAQEGGRPSARRRLYVVNYPLEVKQSWHFPPNAPAKRFTSSASST